MKRLAAAALALLALAAPAAAQPISLPLEVRGKVKVVHLVEAFPVTVHAPAGGALYFWEVPAGVEFEDRGNVIEVTAAPQGRHAIRVKYVQVDFEKKAVQTFFAHTALAVGDVGPGPDPGPGPGPTPPPPPPSGDFRCLIVWETTQNHTREQLQILNSTKVVDYLTQKTVKVDGGLGWRKWDKDVVLDPSEKAFWKDLWAATKPQLPAALPVVVTVTGTNAVIHPLPATEEATLELLRRYGK